MTANGAKILADDEKSLVEVRQESGEMWDFQRIGVPCGLSGRCIGCVDGQKLLNRRPYCGIIDSLACRSTDCEVKWEIPANTFKVPVNGYIWRISNL